MSLTTIKETVAGRIASLSTAVESSVVDVDPYLGQGRVRLNGWEQVLYSVPVSCHFVSRAGL